MDGWLALSLVFAFASFAETLSFGHFTAFLPILVTSLGVPAQDAATTVGLLSAASLLLGLPLVPFWGAWAERYSRKAIIVRSSVVEAVLFLLLGLVSQVWQVFLLVPLAGLVLGNTGVMLTEISDRAPRERLGFAIGLVGVAGPLGLALGPAIGGFLADLYGVQMLFLLDAVIVGIAVLALVFLYHEHTDRPHSGVPVMTLVRRSLLTVARTPLARGVFFTYLFLLLGQRLVMPFLALFVQQMHGEVALATYVGLVAGAYGVAAAIGSPAAGALGDRIGYRQVLWGALLLTAACFLVAAFLPELAGFAADYALIGVGIAASTAMLFTLLATGLPDDIRSAVLNLALAPFYLSAIAGSLIATQILSTTGGDLRPLWVLGSIFVALALIPALRVAAPARSAVRQVSSDA